MPRFSVDAPAPEPPAPSQPSAGVRASANSGGFGFLPAPRQPNRQKIEVTVRHFIENVEVKVQVPVDASFLDVKEALAEKLGSDEVLEQGYFMWKHASGALTAYRDGDSVGEVRRVLLLRASLRAHLGQENALAEQKCEDSATLDEATGSAASTALADGGSEAGGGGGGAEVEQAPGLTLDQILNLQADLREAFTSEEFQRKLREVEAIHGKAFIKLTSEHTKLFLTVQNDIMPKYDLPRGQKGVLQMLQEGARYNDNSEYNRNRLMLNRLLGMAPEEDDEDEYEEDAQQEATSLKIEAPLERKGIKDQSRCLIVFGGEDGKDCHATSEVFDSRSMSFSPGPRMGSQRSSSAVAVLNDRSLLVIGGCVGTKCLDTTEVLDLVTMVFTKGPSLRTARATCAASMIDSRRLLVLGGRDKGTRLHTTEVLDLANMTFVPGPNMLTKRNMCSVAPIDSKHLIVLGGHDGNGGLNSTELLDVRTMRFTSGPKLSSPRFNFGAIAVLGADAEVAKIFVFGGAGGGDTKTSVVPRLDTTEVLDVKAMSFRPGPRMATKRSGCGVLALGKERLLVVGGFDGTNRHASSEVLDLERMTFGQGPNLEIRRGGCAAASC